MARGLRIEIPGGRYHVTARGNERRNIFRDDRDREHFLELLASLPERFGVRIHGYVLMSDQRDYTEQAVREGIAEGPWERLMGGVVLGSQPFAQALGQKFKGSAREGPSLKSLGPRLEWADIVGAIERVKGEPWEAFRDRHGDWGRDGALWLGRRQGRMTLRSLAGLRGFAISPCGESTNSLRPG